MASVALQSPPSAGSSGRDGCAEVRLPGRGGERAQFTREGAYFRRQTAPLCSEF